MRAAVARATTTRTERGLELAKDYLRKILIGIDIQAASIRFPQPTREQGFDLLAAIEWICHKQAVDDRRRGPRDRLRTRRVRAKGSSR
jgi:hypothetical protein